MSSTPDVSSPPSLSLWTLAWIFFKLGALAFGGMWAAMDRIEKELVIQRGWITKEQQVAMMMTAALIPAPKFLAFGGMVGYSLRGYVGSCIALTTLILPGASVVLVAVMVSSLGEPGTLLGTVQHTVSLGIVGLLIGNAVRMARQSKVKLSSRLVGCGLWATVPIAVHAFGASLLLMAVITLVLGAWLIQPLPGDGLAQGALPDE
ncbi:MAG: chromate transporter [Litorivicinaceae bacterium]|jgi:chromate transporter|nr:chromate transporter [Litorivicinaceae bacterium]